MRAKLIQPVEKNKNMGENEEISKKVIKIFGQFEKSPYLCIRKRGTRFPWERMKEFIDMIT